MPELWTLGAYCLCWLLRFGCRDSSGHRSAVGNLTVFVWLTVRRRQITRWVLNDMTLGMLIKVTGKKSAPNQSLQATAKSAGSLSVSARLFQASGLAVPEL